MSSLFLRIVFATELIERWIDYVRYFIRSDRQSVEVTYAAKWRSGKVRCGRQPRTPPPPSVLTSSIRPLCELPLPRPLSQAIVEVPPRLWRSPLAALVCAWTCTRLPQERRISPTPSENARRKRRTVKTNKLWVFFRAILSSHDLTVCTREKRQRAKKVAQDI